MGFLFASASAFGRDRWGSLFGSRGQICERLCQQIVEVPVPQVAEQFVASFVAVPVPLFLKEIVEVVRLPFPRS